MMKKTNRKVIFISDQLGYRCGGCNTINYELCMALQQIVEENVKIYALVINCSKEERLKKAEEKAENLGIKILHQNIFDINNLKTEECEDICTRIFDSSDDRQQTVWIGHDIFTGKAAVILAGYTLGISAICIHTDYDTIEGLKGVNAKGILKENQQRQIILGADIVFAIGPRLMERVREVRKDDIYELIPGLSEFPPNELSNNRAIVTFGRFEGNVAEIKQIRLVMAAFGRTVAQMNDNKDYVLHVIGTPGEQESELRKLAEKYAERRLSIHFLEYTQDRDQLFNILRNNCVGLMISLSEGFGLTGWEIISSGIPLILTKKSGLYDYLVREFGYLVNGLCLPIDLKGGTADRMCDDDIELVAKSIITVFRNTEQMRKAAEELRRGLNKQTWYVMAQGIADKLGLQTNEFGRTEIYSDTYKARQDCIEEILNKLEREEIGRKHVIFFGGISQNLCGVRLIRKLEHWLRGDKDRRIVLCYESGGAAIHRAGELDVDKMPKDGLSTNPVKRMKQKEQLVESSVCRYSESVRNQIILIKLDNVPMTYVVAVDSDLYVTLRLENRSSEAMTMKISDTSIHEKRSIIKSMIFTLEKQNEKTNEEWWLINILNQFDEDNYIKTVKEKYV